MPDKVTADDIRDALSGYLGECAKLGTDPVAETSAWYQLMSERLRMDFSGLRRWDREASAKKFNGQVLTQLNSAVRSGLLVKRHVYRDTVFYTPEKARALDEAAVKKEEAAEQERQRVLTIRLRLESLGIFPQVGRSTSVELSLDDWHRLVTLAENGTALRRDS